MEVYLEPNPNVRLEMKVRNRLDRKKPQDGVVQKFGDTLVESGDTIGAESPYGSSLVSAGRVFQQIGASWSGLVMKTEDQFVTPLHSFIDGEYKEIGKQRSRLSRARLDLDAAKSRARKVQASNPERLALAEAELRSAQWEFDEQFKSAQMMLERLDAIHVR
jgi:endophilin-B1